MIYESPNCTVNGVGISMLWCPSDGDIVGLRYPGMPGDGWDCSPIPMTFSSYAGNLGPLIYGWDDPTSTQMQGIFAHNGNQVAAAGRPASDRSGSPASPTARVTRFIYGEHAHSRISAADPGDYYGINWWTSGDYGDTTFSTIFPPNFFVSNDARTLQASPNRAASVQLLDSATSQHPGGCQLRVLRWLGPVHQELGQYLESASDHQSHQHRVTSGRGFTI